MKLSENFTLEELVNSATAKAKGIDNTPTKKVIDELTKLAKTVLQPLRNVYGKPIIVTSGYRCPQLNTAVKGSKTSQHMLGQAADVKAKSDTPKDNKELFDVAYKLMKEGKIVVGQLIDEYNYDWVHISTQGSHKNQVLHIK